MPQTRIRVWRYNSTVSNVGTRWQLSGQFRALSIYIRGNSRRYPLDRRLGGPQGRYECGQENSRATARIQPPPPPPIPWSPSPWPSPYAKKCTMTSCLLTRLLDWPHNTDRLCNSARRQLLKTRGLAGFLFHRQVCARS
jgi:hypothetical protein